MIEKLKIYMVEVGLKKLGPSAIKGAIVAGVSIIAAHAGALSQWGVTADAHKLIIDLDVLGNWALVAGTGIAMAAMTAAQHTTVAAVTGKPQSGDARVNPPQPVDGGSRPGDPPKVV